MPANDRSYPALVNALTGEVVGVINPESREIRITILGKYVTSITLTAEELAAFPPVETCPDCKGKGTWDRLGTICRKCKGHGYVRQGEVQ